MTITALETNLYQRLTPFFADHGYTLLTGKKQFRRISTSGFQNVILSSVFGPDTLLAVNFGCRHEHIEQIAQQFLNNPSHLWADANTLLVSTGRFSGSPSFRYTIHSEAELPDVCDQIERFFDRRGFDFLSTDSTLAQLDQLLNEFPDQPCPYVYNQTHRCYKGLIAARLNHNPRFDSLIDQYRQLLVRQTQDPYEQLYFERLIAYLHHYSAN